MQNPNPLYPILLPLFSVVSAVIPPPSFIFAVVSLLPPPSTATALLFSPYPSQASRREKVNGSDTRPERRRVLQQALVFVVTHVVTSNQRNINSAPYDTPSVAISPERCSTLTASNRSTQSAIGSLTFLSIASSLILKPQTMSDSSIISTTPCFT
ncbi:hypothetical protein PIB30_009687 [Stylosanthes scabra]|uniref:Uncharacterized protein n=1 Tax=Stylosanthes scabra TaxID=79078 RepID=A0ABU6V6P7_9FABA|nr:hypothetical protein [Stylosanthes scabra]